MLPVVTRWSSNLVCVKRYHDIFDHIRAAFIHPDCPAIDPPMDRTEAFREELSEKLEMLLTMNEMTTHLQESGLTLSKALLLFEIALDQDDTEDNAGFDGIGVNPSYLDLSNSVFINPDFLTGVRKIQDGKAHELNQTKKVAVECLRKTPVIRVEPTEESVGGRSKMTKLSRAVKKYKSEAPATYVDCNFILATAVDVERLWSLAKNVLTDKRRGMATMMVQVILFLKENRELWNCNTVYKSIANVQKKAAGERRRKREEQLQEQENMQQAIEQANTISVDDSRRLVIIG